MNEETGILGNLPRSRPGRRSERRERPTGGRSSAARAAPERRPAPGEPGGRPSEASNDLISGAARAAGQAATAGLAVASRLASGTFRRLPRP